MVLHKIMKIPSAEPERKKPDHGYMWICPECGLEVHSDFSRCVRCGWGRPSAEPPRGFWVTIERGEQGYSAGDFRCSICGKPNKCYTLTAFCPNCGAKMGETE